MLPLGIFDKEHRKHRDGALPSIDHFLRLRIFPHDLCPPGALVADLGHVEAMQGADQTLVGMWDLHCQFFVQTITSLNVIDMVMLWLCAVPEPADPVVPAETAAPTVVGLHPVTGNMVALLTDAVKPWV